MKHSPVLEALVTGGGTRARSFDGYFDFWDAHSRELKNAKPQLALFVLLVLIYLSYMYFWVRIMAHSGYALV